MVDQVWLIYDGVKNAEYDVTDPSKRIFNFETGALAPARFQAGVEVSGQVLSEPSPPFTAEELTVTSNPLFLSQVVEGYPVEIQPTAYTGTPAAQVTRTFTLDGNDVLGDLSGANIYNVPAATAGQTLFYGEDASNNVVDGGDVLITRSTSVSDTVVAAAVPAITASASLSGLTLTITVDSLTGAPTPTTTLTALTLDGQDVLGNETGTGPWTYEAPTVASSQTVAWTVTASSPEGSDTASGSETIAASTLRLLDDYPGARGAWSVRALSSSTTNVMRVRRAGDDQERDLTEAEISDGTLTTFAGAASAYVKTLYDQSGNGRDATNANVLQQPIIVDLGSLITKNGKPSMRFARATDFLKAPVPSGATVPVSVFAAATYESSANLQVIFGGQGEGSNLDFCLVYVPDGTSNLGLFNGTVLTSSSAFTAGELSLISANFDGPTSEGFVDGVSVASGDAGVKSNNEPAIGIGARPFNTPNGHWAGEISEVIYYASDQSANQSAIDQNIADYFGVTI